jgi:ABC-type microcin C transport system permease subunit YejE
MIDFIIIFLMSFLVFLSFIIGWSFGALEQKKFYQEKIDLIISRFNKILNTKNELQN